MFFGLCNSLLTFQAMMNDIFAEEIAEGWVVSYMDDILIFLKDEKEHMERTRCILKKLHNNDLFLKPEKCAFNIPQTEFLGLVVSHNKLAMDPAKLEGIRNWDQPLMV